MRLDVGNHLFRLERGQGNADRAVIRLKVGSRSEIGILDYAIDGIEDLLEREVPDDRALIRRFPGSTRMVIGIGASLQQTCRRWP